MVDEKSIVRVNEATGIRVLAFTISGPGPFVCDIIRYGVWVENGGSATIDDNHVRDIRDTDLRSLDPPISGCHLHGRRYVGQIASKTTFNGLTDNRGGALCEIDDDGDDDD